uniref:Hepatocellular carcinoma-associated antigen 59 n=3 Tax=Canis lupus TaxID=9612 RepID=A0A8C0M8A7_CANLF
MVDMKKLKERGKDKISEEEDLHLGTSFSAETNRRDEDADMMKYIETELKKRKGIVEHEEQKVKPKNAEDCLYKLPENIRVSSAKKTEEMLSNQMLSGIPEVDLGIDAKIKNIISTEDAKARLLAEQQNKKKDSETSFVPTNIAMNYVQHNRFYHKELNVPVRRNKDEGPWKKKDKPSFLDMRKVTLGPQPSCDLCVNGTTCPKHISCRTS